MVRMPRKRANESQLPEVVCGIPIPHPFSLDAFLLAVARGRGRPIDVVSIPADENQGGLGGVWVRRDHEDWILVEESTSPVHREHIVLRGVAHMLFGHQTDFDQVEILLADRPGGGVQQALARHRYDPDQERAADEFASALMTRVRRPAEPFRPDSALERLSRVLEPNGR